MKLVSVMLGLCVCGPVLGEPPLGRLFFTPAERTAQAASPVAAPPMLNGWIRREGKLRALWLDGVRVQPASALSAVPPVSSLRLRRHD